MRVVGLPSDTGGCGELRIARPVAAAGGTVATEIPAVWRDLPDGGRVAVEVLVDADVVIMQRVMSDDTLSAMLQMQRQGIAVVLDIDDDFSAIPAKNQAHYQTHPDWLPIAEYEALCAETGGGYSRRRIVTVDTETYIHFPGARPRIRRENLLRAARMADLVTVSTPALARRYVRHERVALLRNGVPASWLGAATDGNALAWTAHLGTHPHDLDDLDDSVSRALRATGMRLVTPDHGRAAKALGLTAKEWRHRRWTPFCRYPDVHAKGLRLGMAPLAHDAFNAAKSWLKGLEFSAWGVPWVATPTPEYRTLHSLGVGALADSPDEWYRTLVDLARNEDRRADQIGAGLALASDWTIEKRVPEWVDAWDVAAKHARAARKKRVAA